MIPCTPLVETNESFVDVMHQFGVFSFKFISGGLTLLHVNHCEMALETGVKDHSVIRIIYMVKIR